VEKVLQDVRYGLRLMLARPGFTAVAIIALALGIGANTSVFSVVNGVLLRPLTYQEPDRLVKIWEKWNEFNQGSVAYPNFKDWEAQNQTFEQIAAYQHETFTITGSAFAERVPGRAVSAAFFRALGVSPALGRDFLSTEDQPGSPLVAIVSNQFWKTRMGGSASVVDSTIVLNGKSYTVIGVLPSSFHFYDAADVYTCIAAIKRIELENRAFHPGIQVIARLKPGVTVEQARADMTGIAASLGSQYPDTNGGHTVTIDSLYKSMVGDVGGLLVVLLGAVALVLLIACVNVANLLLARSTARSKEIGIRVALGAGRSRIARQLLTESVMLGLAGGGLGLITAWLGTGAMLKMVPAILPRAEDISVDVRVLGFTLAASVLTGLVFGLAPAIQATRTDLNSSLKEGSRGSTGAGHRVLSGLVVFEIAITLVSLACAGLLLRTFIGLRGVKPGFDPKNVLTFQVSLSTGGYSDPTRIRRFFQDLVGEVRNVPGVSAAATTSLLPLSDEDSETQFFINGKPKPPVSELPNAMFYITSPGYIESMNIPLLRGRDFTIQDNEKRPYVVLVDQNMQRLYFDDEDPVGRHLTLQAGNEVSFDMEVVGVVGHVKQENLDTEAGSTILPQLYMPFDQIPDQFLASGIGELHVVVRTASDPAGLVPAMKQTVRNIDRDVPVFDISTVEEVVASSIARQRFTLLLLGSFAILALILASVGIYGVMAYSVTQRSHEIGIRMALGAGRPRILGIVVGSGVKLALFGVGAGLIGSIIMTRFLSGMLYNISPYDPVTLSSVALLLAVVATIASYIPARRAIKVDPMVALRYE
jgi:predicted permease